MSKSEPTIQKFMSCNPFAIESNLSVKEAQTMMSDLQIRHLPVMHEGRVYGIISDRDIKMASSLVGGEAGDMAVVDVCHEQPYQIHPDTPLHEVADEMAVHHYGCAIVVQNEKLVGIFTTVDACRAISSILQQRYHSHES